MNALFVDKKLQHQFEQEGYVKIRLLNEQGVNELTELFNVSKAEHATVATLHHTTTDTQKSDLILQVDTSIKRIFTPALKNILIDYKPLVGCFHIKEPGTGSATGIHQDPTFVDEKKYCSANVWVALQDVDEQNGNLFFIPGSNRIESLRITPDSPNYYENFYGDLSAMLVQVPLKKGEAVIFNNATIHGATDNKSGSFRLAATLLVCSKSADWMIYYKDSDTPADKIEKYQLNFDTFISIPKDGRPDKNAFKEFISYKFPVLSKEEFLMAAGKASYFQRVKNIFKRVTGA